MRQVTASSNRVTVSEPLERRVLFAAIGIASGVAGGSGGASPDVDRLPAPAAVAKSFGTVRGQHGVRATVKRGAGHRVTFALSGPGRGTVTVAPDGGYDLTLTKTTARTALTIKTNGAAAAIDALNDAAPLGTVTAPGVALTGELTTGGGLQRLTLGDLTHATVSAGSTGSPAVNFGAVAGASTVSIGGTPTVTVDSWVDGSELTADTLAGLTCRGDFSGFVFANNAGPIVIGGNLVGARIEVSYTFDPGNAVTNDRVPHVLQSLHVTDSITGSFVGANVYDTSASIPSAGLILERGGQIGPVVVGGTVSADTRIVAYTLPTTAQIDGQPVATAGDVTFSV